MTDNIEVSGDGSSTALKVLLAELASEDEAQDTVDESKEQTEESSPSHTDQSPRGDSEDTPLLEGISTDVSEEPVDEGKSEQKKLRETLVFGQESDITKSTSFRPTSEDDEDIFPLKGSGQIDSMFISSPNNTFRVFLELDEDKILDSITWSNLQSQSNELAHIGAYQKSGGEYIVSINDYPFNEEIDFSITPTSTTTFNTIRVEIMLDEYTTGVET